MPTSSRRLPTIAGALVALAHISLCSIGLSQFDVQDNGRLVVRDVALGAGGMLRGRLIDRTGQPLRSEVALWRGSTEISRSHSDQSGRFVFTNVGAGLHRLVSDCDVALCRLWAADTAPPAARPEIMLNAGSVVRGQCGCRGWRRCNDCCYAGGGDVTMGTGMAPVPAPPAVSTEELRSFAPDLPDEQFAALTRADVVIVNPEHISMVIQYNAVDGTATVVAKGGDDLALQIQSVARNAGVPIVRNQELAQALYAQVEVGQAVPEALLGQLAEIMAQLAAAVPAPAFEPGFVGEPGGTFQPAGGRNLLIGAGIIGAGIAIPVALANEEEDLQHGS